MTNEPNRRETARVASDPEFRTDLFRGTAPFYDKFRLAYPAVLLDDLRMRVDDGHRQTARSRVRHRPDHVRSRVALRRGLGGRPGTGSSRVRPREGAQARSRQRSLDRRSRRGCSVHQSFELVAIGNAFHRLQRRVVAEAAMHWLVPGGHLAVLWSNSPWTGREAWQHAMAEAVRHWTDAAGAAERIPANIEEHLAAEQHTTLLASVGFTIVGEFEFTTAREWTVETLTGFMYATSFLFRNQRSAKTSRPSSATFAPACWRWSPTASSARKPASATRWRGGNRYDPSRAVEESAHVPERHDEKDRGRSTAPPPRSAA